MAGPSFEMFYTGTGDREAEVKRLLDGGLDVNSLNERGKTALYIAMLLNRVSIVRLLLARPGTRLDITDSTGDTALHYAWLKNGAEVVRLFCQDARCTPDLLNKKSNAGDTPQMTAVGCGNLVIVQELARVGGGGELGDQVLRGKVSGRR